MQFGISLFSLEYCSYIVSRNLCGGGGGGGGGGFNC